MLNNINYLKHVLLLSIKKYNNINYKSMYFIKYISIKNHN